VHQQPEIHGFISRRIAKQHFLMWVKNPDMFEDAHLLTPISHRDLASAVEESLATFPVYLPLGVFLAQNPQILESTLRKLKPSFDAAFRGRFARIIPETSEELVRLIRSFSDHGKLTLSSGTVFEEESALVISDLPLGTAAAALQQESPDSSWLRLKMEDKRFFILKPPEGQTSNLSSSSSSSSSSTSSFGAIEEIRAQGGTLYLALGEASRQRKLLELASFPSMDEMPQAEGRRARQEHGVLVARGLAEGVAKIVEEATFTDALGTEFGLGYKLQRLKRRAEESFADGYGQGAKDAAKGIELDFSTRANLPGHV
jgi:hypothetical protein